MRTKRNIIHFGDEVKVSASSLFNTHIGTIIDDNFESISDCINRIISKYPTKKIGTIIIFNQTRDTIGSYTPSGKKV